MKEHRASDFGALSATTRAEIEASLPRSLAQFQLASKYIPNGSPRSRFYWPFPVFIARADGAYLYDLDGNRYIDLLMAHGPLIIGHRHPAVVSALRSQLELGLLYGPPVPEEAKLARLISEHVPNAEWVAFFSSGTEATLAALRVARAATGRDKIAKFEGGYHGWHDLLNYSINSVGPTAVADSIGMSPEAAQQLVVLPFNDPRAIDKIHELSTELAGVVIEPVEGAAGALPSEPGFVADVQRACADHGILLIADEVITGFRMGPSGAAGHYGFEADLTVLGKAIGGGLPIGALCGARESREIIESPEMKMAGTFAANPMAMVAGKAQLDVLLNDPSSYRRLSDLGERLRTGISAAFAEVGVQGYATGAGSIWGLHFSKIRPKSIRDRVGRNRLAAQAAPAYLRREGVFFTSSPLGFVSTAHTDDDINRSVEAVTSALASMKTDGYFEQDEIA